MGGRDHSCDGCGRGGLGDPEGDCECSDRRPAMTNADKRAIARELEIISEGEQWPLSLALDHTLTDAKRVPGLVAENERLISERDHFQLANGRAIQIEALIAKFSDDLPPEMVRRLPPDLCLDGKTTKPSRADLVARVEELEVERDMTHGVQAESRLQAHRAALPQQKDTDGE